MTAQNRTLLELGDIQAAALMPRPHPYAGAYLFLRIDDRRDGRELLRRLLPLLEPVSTFDPSRPVSLGLALSYAGLEALGVPARSLASFPEAFRQGMAARAEQLGDIGESAPEHWEKPLGSKDVHLVVAALARDAGLMQTVLVQAEQLIRELPGVSAIWSLDVHVPPNGREQFGFKDSISQPAVEGTEILGSNPHEKPVKAGEFILGYEDETGAVTVPEPEILGRNGTYVAFRKLHQNVAAFRRYLHDQAADAAEEQLLAAKLVGRWPSGAPLALAADKDDPDLGADDERNNAFLYGDDPRGLKCPVGAHVRRMNARDAVITGQVQLHRMIRRGTNYGPTLPPGVLYDDGADRGLMFAFVGADLVRQFEFVQSQWVNDGKFIGAPTEHDPLIGVQDEATFTVPRKPIRRRLTGLPSFVVNRGGEYCFMPGLRALRWLADLDT